VTDVIYVEQACRSHPRVRRILARFPRASIVHCDHYGEVFNRGRQNFRLQKRRPALILAHKHQGLVLPAPEGYDVGGQRNYYFSHLLNCVYDCRYCFLQGMYRSAHYVLFVNFEDFFDAVAAHAGSNGGVPTWFFSGYDCDSLALEPLTGFAGAAVDRVAGLPDARLELRTKSTQIRTLLSRPAPRNVVAAFSFTPEVVSRRLEHGVAALDKRIRAMRELAEHGWRIGLRFDPVIHHPEFGDSYRSLFERIFSAVALRSIHSVTLGAFRMPAAFHRRIAQLYPEEPLYAVPTARRGGVLGYPPDVEARMLAYCRRELARHVPPDKLFAQGPPECCGEQAPPAAEAH